MLKDLPKQIDPQKAGNYQNATTREFKFRQMTAVKHWHYENFNTSDAL